MWGSLGTAGHVGWGMGWSSRSLCKQLSHLAAIRARGCCPEGVGGETAWEIPAVLCFVNWLKFPLVRIEA